MTLKQLFAALFFLSMGLGSVNAETYMDDSAEDIKALIEEEDATKSSPVEDDDIKSVLTEEDDTELAE